MRALKDSTETRTVFTNQWLDENGATAFLRASQSGDVELMKLLLVARCGSEDQHRAERQPAGRGGRHRLGRGHHLRVVAARRHSKR